MNVLKAIGRKGQMGRINDAVLDTYEIRVSDLQKRCNKYLFLTGLFLGAAFGVAAGTGMFLFLEYLHH